MRFCAATQQNGPKMLRRCMKYSDTSFYCEMLNLRGMRHRFSCHGSGEKHIKSMIFDISVTQNHLIHVTEVVLMISDFFVNVL